MFFLCFSLSSSPSSSATSFSTYSSKSFSSRMRSILYFHALKLSTPSSFSLTLVLYLILSNMVLETLAGGGSNLKIIQLIYNDYLCLNHIILVLCLSFISLWLCKWPTLAHIRLNVRCPRFL